MRESNPSDDDALISVLNQLLRVDQDAERAYGEAIEVLADDEHQLALIRHREDHQRHIRQLSRLIRLHGGEPLDVDRLPVGPFTWGVRAVAGLGGDREILSAIRANEEQICDDYQRRANAALPVEAIELLRLHARDEQRHYAWAEDVLEGAGEEADGGWAGTRPGRAAVGSRSVAVE